MKLLIKFPTRNRPEKFFSVLDLYYEKCSDITNVMFLITCDLDDVTMNNDVIINKLKSYKNLTVTYSDNKSKIDAVNYGINGVIEDYDVLLIASDDMIPKVDGYDKIILEQMSHLYPDTDGVLWYNDGHQGPKLNTLCILGKKYFKRFGYVYHPSYKSLWCDNEFMTVANHLGRQTYIDNVIIKHEHPDCGYGQYDQIHFINSQNNNTDCFNFMERKKINFGL